MGLATVILLGTSMFLALAFKAAAAGESGTEYVGLIFGPTWYLSILYLFICAIVLFVRWRTMPAKVILFRRICLYTGLGSVVLLTAYSKAVS